jgi:hypothetical protein
MACMLPARDYFQAWPPIVAAEDARIGGAWTAKPQRRYASAKQSGTGEGPFIETVDWRWDGAFEAASSLVGLAMLVVDGRVYWAKSEPPAERPAVSFSAFGWAGCAGSVYFTGSFHGTFLPAVPVEIGVAPPEACILGKLTAIVGVPHVVAQIGGVLFAVVLLPASAVRVGRNRLWRLREGIADGLPEGPRRLFTRGRSGVSDLPAA